MNNISKSPFGLSVEITYPSLSNESANLLTSSRLKVESLSVIIFASFLNAFPKIGLLGTASTVLTVFGLGKRFSATSLSPVASECCVRS